MFEHNTLHFFIDLHFDLAAPNLPTAVLFFTSNVSLNLRSYFLALGFLVDTYELGVIRLLSVHTLVIENSADPIIALYRY